MSYWDGKEARARRARDWTAKMETGHADEIQKVADKTVIYDEHFANGPYYEPDGNRYQNVFVEDLDSVSAIYKYQAEPNLAVLNFASYKNPGGKFLEGSKAQEECLCHESFLYNVLKTKEKGYYENNRKKLNRALYENRALYSPSVRFFHGNELTCDVITCAAPNFYAARKYQNVDFEENSIVLDSRIRFVLDVTAANGVKTLILGAFGCGVFGQNPVEVASIFKKYLPGYPFNTIVFAVPDKASKNYQAFAKAFLP